LNDVHPYQQYVVGYTVAHAVPVVVTKRKTQTGVVANPFASLQSPFGESYRSYRDGINVASMAFMDDSLFSLENAWH
jgi:hypothetical protein